MGPEKTCLFAEGARLGLGGIFDHLRACVARQVPVRGVGRTPARGGYAGVAGDQTIQRKGAT